MFSTTIFEQYETFLRDHTDDLSSPVGAVRMLQDKGYFASFADSLTENFDESTRNTVMGVLNRQREAVLEEASNVPASSFTHGWTVLSFPILTDIYAEPIISQLMNVYPVSSSIVSIPRTRIKATVRPYDGGAATEYIIPTATKLIRPGFMEAICPAGQSNIFSKSGVATDGSLKMNRRYTLIDQITVTDTTDNKTIDISVNFKPDSRDQFFGEAMFAGYAGGPDAATANKVVITGHVNYDTGSLVIQGTVAADSAATNSYTFKEVRISARFVAVNTMNGRTTVKVVNEMTDITIDPNEDFLIELNTEDIQDYRSIFKIDLARTLSEAIKRQILLNKDFDLALSNSAHN